MYIKDYKTLMLAPFVLVLLCVLYTNAGAVMQYMEVRHLSYVVFLSLAYVFLTFVMSGYRAASVTILFFISLVVFIYGRYIAFLLSPEVDIFVVDYFADYQLDETDSARLTFMVLIFLFSFFYGVLLASGCDHSKFAKPHSVPKLSRFLSPVFLVLTLVICAVNIYTGYLEYRLVSSEGYLSLYSFQGEAYSGGKFYSTLFYVIFGISYSYSLKREKTIMIISLAIVGVLSLLAGQRSGFVMALLALVWAYGVRSRLSWVAVFGLLFLCFISMVFLGSLSARNLGVEVDQGFFTFVSGFLYNQGISLMVFDVSMNISDYPIFALLQSFFPGISKVGSLFFDLKMQDVSYADYLAYTLNPEMYIKGQGLGWSLPSTFYVWSFGNLILFVALSMGFGYLLRLIDVKSFERPFFLGLCACLISSLVILPRSQFSNVIPLAFYFGVFYTLFFGLNSCLRFIRFRFSEE